MRNETIIKTYAQFNELNKEQQNKVIENFREDVHNDFDHMIDDIYINFKELLSIIGFEDIEINYSGFCSQGDGASFTGGYNFEGNSKKIIKEIKENHLDYFDEINQVYKLIEALENETQKEAIGGVAVYRSGHYYHECSIYCDDEAVQDLSRFISKMIYKELESQYDYLHTDEYICESINCNEYEFDLDTLEIA